MLLTAGVARANAPSATDLELAKAHFHTGQIYYQNGRYPDAAREFEEAYRLSNKADLLFNMGKSYDGVGDHARAMTAYRRFLAEVPNSADRATVEARVAGLQRLVGRIKITSPVDGAAVLLDGAAMGQTPLADPVEVNPGAHKVEVAREGYRTFRKSVVAAPG